MTDVFMEETYRHFGMGPEDLEHAAYHHDDLLIYGYAPGDYVSKCVACGKEMIADKRAGPCFQCAHEYFHLMTNAKKLLKAAEALYEKYRGNQYYEDLAKAIEDCKGLGEHPPKEKNDE